MTALLPPLAGLSLAEIRQIRADLFRAMASGTQSVRYADGTSVTYRSFKEMEDTLHMIDSRMTAATITPGDLSLEPVRAIRLIPFSGFR